MQEVKQKRTPAEAPGRDRRAPGEAGRGETSSCRYDLYPTFLCCQTFCYVLVNSSVWRDLLKWFKFVGNVVTAKTSRPREDRGGIKDKKLLARNNLRPLDPVIATFALPGVRRCIRYGRWRAMKETK